MCGMCVCVCVCGVGVCVWCVCVCMCVCVCVHVCACMHVCIHECMCVCVCVPLCVYEMMFCTDPTFTQAVLIVLSTHILPPSTHNRLVHTKQADPPLQFCPARGRACRQCRRAWTRSQGSCAWCHRFDSASGSPVGGTQPLLAGCLGSPGLGHQRRCGTGSPPPRMSETQWKFTSWHKSSFSFLSIFLFLLDRSGKVIGH